QYRAPSWLRRMNVSLVPFLRRWRALPGNVRGGVTMIIAAMFLSVMVALIKQAGSSLHVMEILFFRQLAMIMIAAPVIWSSFPQSLITQRPVLQAARIGTAFLAMLLGFTAIIHLPLAEATTISFGKTFFITILAIVLLGETVGVRRWAAVAVGFVGVLIVAWPSGQTAVNVYGLLAIVSAALVGFVMVLVRRLSQVDQPITILSYQAFGVGLLMLPGAIWFWKTPTMSEFVVLAAIGGLAVVGQYLNILALKSGEASAIAPIDYIRLVYAILLGLWMFNEWPEPRVFIGSAIIVGAAVYTLHRERIVARVKTQSTVSRSGRVE
ncbi:MAG: DMT family transporter, partial [Hyphomicrobiaceae bacterium]